MLDGEENVELPVSVVWLAPQFLILGLGDGFTLVGLREFFYDQFSDSIISLGTAFFSVTVWKSFILLNYQKVLQLKHCVLSKNNFLTLNKQKD